MTSGAPDLTEIERVGDVPVARLGALDAELIRYIDGHCEAEAGQVREYQALATSPNDAVRYLAELLAHDEERHHRIMIEMRNHLLAGATGDGGPRVPAARRLHDPELRRTLRRLRAAERRDLWSLRRLRRKLGVLRHDSLHGALVDALVLDTKKHLRFVRRMEQLVR
jgi:hypothetical protein